MARRQVVVEEVVFNSYQDAVNAKEHAEMQIEKINGCKILALIGTICSLISMMIIYSKYSDLLIMVGVIISIVCYVKAKCFGGAFKWGLGLAKWGWYLCPFFPADLVIGAMGLAVGFFSFFLFPSLALWGVKRQAKKDLEDANTFINNYQIQTDTQTN